MKNVIAAYPDGGSHQITVYAKTKDALTEKSVKQALKKRKKFTVTAFKTKAIGQSVSD